MEDFEMSEQKTSVGTTAMHLTFLSILGVVVMVIGFGIVLIPGAPFRGSGLGTVAILAGAALVALDYLRSKRRTP